MSSYVATEIDVATIFFNCMSGRHQWVLVASQPAQGVLGCRPLVAAHDGGAHGFFWRGEVE